MKRRIIYAFRQLKKAPGTTGLAILILGLGIGGNTALFTVTDSVLFRPLAYQESDRIVAVNNGDLEPVGIVSWLNYADFSKRSKSYDEVAAFTVDEPVVRVSESVERVSTVRTTANLFDVLRIQPVLGRCLRKEDSLSGALPVLVATNAFWREDLNSDPNVVGKQLRIGSTLYTVVGVLPAGVQFPDIPGNIIARGIWLPLQTTSEMLTHQDDNFLAMIGRLRPGVDIEAAQREALVIAQAMNQSAGANAGKVAFTVLPFKNLVVGNVRGALFALTMAMALVLLIACADVANLQSARFLSRTQEFAIRTALGASRCKLISQVLEEVAVLCALGAAAGLAFAWALIRLVTFFPKETIARGQEIHFRWEVIAALAAIGLLTTILSALVPALQTTRSEPQLRLTEAVRGTSAGIQRRTLARWLTTGEVALSVILLVATVLMFRTLLRLETVIAGFDPQRVLMFQAVPSQSAGVFDSSQTSSSAASPLIRIYEPTLEQILRLPGVTGAAFTSAAPLNDISMQTGFSIVGRNDRYPPVLIRAVTPDYAHVLGTPILSGRMISESDTPESRFVAVVNQAFIAQYLKGADPIGEQLEFAGPPSALPQPFTIVGVVANTVQSHLNQAPDPEISIAYRQILPTSPLFPLLVTPGATYVVRTLGNVDVIPSIRNLFQNSAPGTALDAMQTLQMAQNNDTFHQRLGLYLIGGFAALALLLVIAGLYGVLSQLVGQRRREIGIRMALGANRSEILRLIGTHGMLMIVIGLTVGLIASLAVGRFVSAFLYGVKPYDPLSFVAVVLILLLVGSAATFIPAYRASRVEPFDALRSE